MRTRGSRIAAAAGAGLLLGGAVACGGGGAQQAQRSAAQVLTAAFEKTTEAKSAKVTMTVSVPQSLADGEDAGGEMTMSGVMGWDPAVMDVTMKGPALSLEPGAPSEVRMIVRDDVMYMDGGAAAAKETDGKRWMKFDYGAMAEKSGDKDLAKAMGGGLTGMNQDPSEQLAVLLDSPNLKHLGSETIDGQRAEHYKGTLTVEEMLGGKGSLDVLGAKERKEFLDGVKESGIKGYDTEVWVNEDDLPLRMDVGMKTPDGTVETSMTFSDYGTAIDVKAPPAPETFDMMEMMKGLGGPDGPEGLDDLDALDEESGPDGPGPGGLDLSGLDAPEEPAQADLG